MTGHTLTVLSFAVLSCLLIGLAGLVRPFPPFRSRLQALTLCWSMALCGLLAIGLGAPRPPQATAVATAPGPPSPAASLPAAPTPPNSAPPPPTVQGTAGPDPAALARYASALVAAARPCDAAMDRLDPRGRRVSPDRLHAAAEAARDRCYEAAQELLKVSLPAGADEALGRRLKDASTLLFHAYRRRMDAAAAAMAYVDDPRPSHLSAARKAADEAGENLAFARAVINQTFAQQGAKAPF